MLRWTPPCSEWGRAEQDGHSHIDEHIGGLGGTGFSHLHVFLYGNHLPIRQVNVTMTDNREPRRADARA